MHQVKDERFTEEELWKRFHHIPSVQVMINSRRMKFLAKVACSQRLALAPARQMLIAYVNNTRPRGRPIIIKTFRQIQWPSHRRQGFPQILVRWARTGWVSQLASRQNMLPAGRKPIFVSARCHSHICRAFHSTWHAVHSTDTLCDTSQTQKRFSSRR